MSDYTNRTFMDGVKEKTRYAAGRFGTGVQENTHKAMEKTGLLSVIEKMHEMEPLKVCGLILAATVIGWVWVGWTVAGSNILRKRYLAQRTPKDEAEDKHKWHEYTVYVMKFVGYIFAVLGAIALAIFGVMKHTHKDGNIAV